jgi:hypothetical protein
MPFRRRKPTADVRSKVPTPAESIRGRGYHMYGDPWRAQRFDTD